MDKVNPENGIAWTQQPSKSAAIKKTWNSFVESSTLHGMRYVFTSPTTFRRILWAFFLLSGMGYFSFHSSKLLEKYFSYPIATKVTLVHEKEPDFPSVTICNFNMFRKSLVNAYNYEQVLRYTTRDQFGKFAGIEINDSNIDWSVYEGVNMSLVYHLGGHQMQDMLKGCSWSGEKCSYKNFTPVLTSMGLCHTFNSGKSGQDILRVKDAGAKFGLSLMLSIEQSEYFGLMTLLAGIKVLIHHHETPPMVAQLGFSVAPGTSTFAAVRKEEVHNLKSPYESNCTDSDVNNLRDYTKYTTSACMLKCHTRHVVKQCGCRDIKMTAIDDAKVCDVHKTSTCVFRKWKTFIGPLTKGFSGVNASDIPHLIENYSDDYSKAYRENLLELNIYFQELNVYFIEQQPAYDFESLLGEIGGQLGLCIGASLLTVLEFCDVTFSIAKIRLGGEG
ncbi:Acid-sensing ion channel 2 [Desmophyllum pertusum]|uniref:Acid-sensing ion channel 2 n=1 Tax=Desmophyllum pertusum TaxID=174260 RepID=A0A9X0CW51_9CNID|nr:Acid-sensing ion channel 2 [Desmophyllum pertusum]